MGRLYYTVGAPVPVSPPGCGGSGIAPGIPPVAGSVGPAGGGVGQVGCVGSAGPGVGAAGPADGAPIGSGTCVPPVVSSKNIFEITAFLSSTSLIRIFCICQ